MASKAVELVFKGNNRSAIKALTGISEQSEKTTRVLKGDADEQTAAFTKTRESTMALKDSMVGLMGMVGITGVALGLKDLVQGGTALQSSQAQLRAALKATGQTAAGTFGKVADAAERLSTKGGFGTTENLQALTAFVRETHSATEAQNLLSLSTNIARGRNMDLASAQQTVARAYTGSVGKLQALLGPMVAAREAQVGLSVAHQREIGQLQNEALLMGRMGPIFLRNAEIRDHITAQQAALAQMTDKHATAQAVLAEATKEFAGATSSYNRTTQGQISDLENSFHNLTEELGVALLPAIDKVVHVAADLAEWMAKNKTVVRDVALGVAALTAAWGGLKIIEGIKGMVLDLGKAFGITGAAGEAAGVEAAAGAEMATIGWRTFMTSTIAGVVIIGLVELVEHWKQVEAAALSAWHGIEKAATAVWNGIVAGARWMVREVKTVWHDLMSIPNAVGHFLSHPFGIGLSGGGKVPRYMAGGGPIGSDTVPAWLSPNEGVLSVQGMQTLGGENSLAALNAGRMPGGFGGDITIRPSPVYVRVDNREISNAVIRYTLERAARGPAGAALVGGSLVAGAPGLPG